MPQVGDVHVDAILENYMTGYTNPDVVYPNMAPSFGVTKDSNKFFTGDKDVFDNVDDLGPRGIRESSPEVDWAQKSDSYVLARFSLKTFLPDDILYNYDNPLNPERRSVKLITNMLDTGFELRFRTAAQMDSNYGTAITLSGSSQWDHATGGNPLGVRDAAALSMLNSTGQEPNGCTMAYRVWQGLRRNPKLTSQFHLSGEDKRITLQQFADLMELDFDKIGIAKRIINGSQIWSNFFAFHYNDMNPGIGSLNWYLTFLREGQADGTQRWRMVDPDGEFFLRKKYQQYKLIDKNCGYRVKSPLATP